MYTLAPRKLLPKCLPLDVIRFLLQDIYGICNPVF